ncbi:hypothetical protein CH260_06030, partial [Rhodococcus sp. 05-2256-B2]
MSDQPDTAVVEMLVELACRAPSVHNSQPWRWTYSEHGLDLYTDTSRVLGVIDPTERQMVMSCGAALDHLEKAAAAFRWKTEIDLLPAPGTPDHLARIRLVHDAHPRSREFDMLSAINRRHSDRRAFGPVPTDRVLTRYLGRQHYGTEMTVLSAESKQTLARASTLSAVRQRLGRNSAGTKRVPGPPSDLGLVRRVVLPDARAQRRGPRQRLFRLCRQDGHLGAVVLTTEIPR